MDEIPLRFLNHYDCPRCGEHWIDAWDSTCDDRCPGCNLSCSPVESEELEGGDEADNE